MSHFKVESKRQKNQEESVNDNELRGIVLKRFYEHRKESHIVLSEDDFENKYSYSDLKRICKQLEEYNLINKWHPTSTGRGPTIGIGQLSALGADVIEGIEAPPVSITINDNKQINISSSENIQVGNQNTLNANTHIENLLSGVVN